jgi:pimeloyl-ACP methyl ester carboxylesterase
VLGMSVGGPYAVATAARHPDRVESLGVVEAPAEVPSLDPPLHRDRLDAQSRAFFTSLATLPAPAVAERMRPEFEAYVAGIAPHDRDDAAVAARWLATLPAADAALVGVSGPAEVARGAREAVGRTTGFLRDVAVTFRPWAFDARAVRCPAFAWYGDGDDTCSPRNGEWYAARLGAAYTLLPGASHLGRLLEHWTGLLAELTGPPAPAR